MTIHGSARREVEDLLSTMLEADGYVGVIRSWPEAGLGHAKVEIIATTEACEDCLVSKSILAMVLAPGLPAGITVEEADLTYPSDIKV